MYIGTYITVAEKGIPRHELFHTGEIFRKKIPIAGTFFGDVA